MRTKLIITEAQLKVLKETLIKEAKNPCWDGYEQVGMKDKGGKQVPNCVPKNNESISFGDNIELEESASNLKEYGSEFGPGGEFDDAELQAQEDFYDKMNQNSKEE